MALKFRFSNEEIINANEKYKEYYKTTNKLSLSKKQGLFQKICFWLMLLLSIITIAMLIINYRYMHIALGLFMPFPILGVLVCVFKLYITRYYDRRLGKL